MSLFYRLNGDKIIFFGPGTYHKREVLKSHGARFNSTDKSWFMTSTPELIALATSIGAVGPVGSNTESTSTPATSELVTSSAPTKPLGADPTTAPAPSAGGLTVRELMAEAQRAVTAAFPNPVWVVGEIQNLTRRGEHLYFEIAESKEGAHATATMTIKANLWGTSYQFLERRHGKDKLAAVFVDGTKVRFYCRVGLYKDRGNITVTIEDVDPAFSQGAMALARAELLRKLRAAGLDRKNKSLRLPAFPLRIAFISAPASRAQSDFEHQLTSDGLFPGTLLFIPCPMQGDRVPKGVVASIAKATEVDADLIVISRGGGSAADLRWFDGEEIAVAIANANVPVIAAIGHHDDHCVAEEVCHSRLKTPTAAADFILDIFRQTRTQMNEHAHWLATALDREMTTFTRTLSGFETRLAQAISLFFVRHQERLSFMALNLGRAFDVTAERQQALFAKFATNLAHEAQQALQIQRQGLNQRANDLYRLVQTALIHLGDQLTQAEQKIIRLDPQPWLQAGWTQLSHLGKLVTSISQINKGDRVDARLRDGLMTLIVEDTTKKS